MTGRTALKPERDFLRAEGLRARGFFNKAIALYGRVLSASNALADPVLWVEAACAEAAARRGLGDAKGARARLRRAKLLSARPGLRSFRRKIELEDALVDRAQGSYARAVRRLDRLLKGSLAGKDWEEAAFILWALGGAFRFQGGLKASRNAFSKSLALARRAGDPTGEGYALFGLGGVSRVMGRLEESARHYSRALRAFEGTDDIFAKAYAQCGFANALRQLGRLREAERRYLVARRLYSRIEDEPDLAYVEWGLGKICLQRGELSRAAKLLGRASALFAKHKETRGMVLADVALAQALHAGGKTRLAESLFEKAVRLARRRRIHAHLEVFT